MEIELGDTIIASLIINEYVSDIFIYTLIHVRNAAEVKAGFSNSV